MEWRPKRSKCFCLFFKIKKKYKIKAPNYAIYAGTWWGFWSTKNTIILYDKCLSHLNNWVGDGAYDIPQPYELNDGEKNFGVKSF